MRSISCPTGSVRPFFRRTRMFVSGYPFYLSFPNHPNPIITLSFNNNNNNNDKRRRNHYYPINFRKVIQILISSKSSKTFNNILLCQISTIVFIKDQYIASSWLWLVSAESRLKDRLNISNQNKSRRNGDSIQCCKCYRDNKKKWEWRDEIIYKIIQHTYKIWTYFLIDWLLLVAFSDVSNLKMEPVMTSLRLGAVSSLRLLTSLVLCSTSGPCRGRPPVPIRSKFIFPLKLGL